VTLTFITNVGDGIHYHVSGHVNLVNVSSNVESKGTWSVSEKGKCH